MLKALVPQPHIRGFPRGWEVVHFHQSARHARDAVALCQETDTTLPSFVVWTCNMIEGGAHNGYYREDYDEAKSWYAGIIERMS